MYVYQGYFSRTKMIFQDFPGPGIFKKKNPGLSRRRRNPVSHLTAGVIGFCEVSCRCRSYRHKTLQTVGARRRFWLEDKRQSELTTHRRTDQHRTTQLHRLHELLHEITPVDMRPLAFSIPYSHNNHLMMIHSLTHRYQDQCSRKRVRQLKKKRKKSCFLDFEKA